MPRQLPPSPEPHSADLPPEGIEASSRIQPYEHTHEIDLTVPPEATHGSVHDRFRHGWLGKLTAAGVAAAAVAGSLYLGKLASNDKENAVATTGTHQVDQTPPRQDEIPAKEKVTTRVDEKVPKHIRKDIKEAIKRDNCETEVTAEEVTDMYAKLFMGEDLSKVPFEELKIRAEAAAYLLEQDRESMGFYQLPDNFEKLWKDASKGRKIPLSVYQETAEEFFEQMGIEAMFNWKHIGDVDDDDYIAKELIDIEADPVSEEKVGDNAVARVQILGMMRTFANTPPELIANYNVGFIAFGDIIDPAFDGREDGTGDVNYIIVDIAHYADDPYQVDFMKTFSQRLGSHEGAHAVAFELCGEILEYDSRLDQIVHRDPAFASFAPGFKYGDDTMSKLEKGKLIGKRKYTSLESYTEGGTVAVATPYAGKKDEAEDFAALFGEYVVYTPNLDDLLSEKQNIEVLKKKIALGMTRITKVPGGPQANSSIETYFIHALRVAEVMAELNARYYRAENRVARYQYRNPDADGMDPELRRLNKKVADHEEALKELGPVLHGTQTHG